MATSEGRTVVTYDDPEDITSTTATIRGYQTCESYTNTEAGFEWGTNTEDPEHTWDSAGVVTEPGVFTLELTGLTQGATYYFKAWVVWPDGSLGDEWYSFTTAGAINRANSIKDLTTLEAIRNVELSAGGGRAYVDADGKFRYESRFGRGI